MRIELGWTVRDRITGLEGVVMGRSEYLTGCAHVGILPRALKADGTSHEYQWIDETRCEILPKFKPVVLREHVSGGKGGPESNAPSM